MNIKEKFYTREENKNNIMNIKELSRLFNLAKGERSTVQFLRDCELYDDSSKKPIADILIGRINNELRSYHIKRIFEAGQRRVKIEDLENASGIRINDSTAELKGIEIKRKKIYNCNFLNFMDSVQGGIRPAIIIQIDKGNEHSSTTIAIPITSATCKGLPIHVEVFTECGLNKESVAQIEQLRVISKRQLLINGKPEIIGEVPDNKMDEIISAVMKEIGKIGLYYNPDIAMEYSLALFGVIQNLKQNKDNIYMQINKNMLIKNFDEYCRHYNKNYKDVYKECFLKIKNSCENSVNNAIKNNNISYGRRSDDEILCPA